jgi:hypothetical protein
MPQQQTSEKLRVPLMILAAISIVGFVWWLAVFTEPSQFAVAQEGELDDGDAPTLSLQLFEQQYPELEGQRLRLEGITVSTMLGPRAFLTALPDGSPYVVRMLPGAEDAPVATGSVVNVTGTIEAISATVLDGWEAEGVITDPTARQIAEFGVNFMNADRIRHRAPEPDGEGTDGDDDSGDDS